MLTCSNDQCDQNFTATAHEQKGYFHRCKNVSRFLPARCGKQEVGASHLHTLTLQGVLNKPQKRFHLL